MLLVYRCMRCHRTSISQILTRMGLTLTNGCTVRVSSSNHLTVLFLDSTYPFLSAWFYFSISSQIHIIFRTKQSRLLILSCLNRRTLLCIVHKSSILLNTMHVPLGRAPNRTYAASIFTQNWFSWCLVHMGSPFVHFLSPFQYTLQENNGYFPTSHVTVH